MSFLSWEQSQQIKKWNEREAQLKELKAENERLRADIKAYQEQIDDIKLDFHKRLGALGEASSSSKEGQ